MRVVLTAIVCLLIAPVAQARAGSPELTTVRDAYHYLNECTAGPLPPGSEKSEMTVRFSLSRDGFLRGKPMITYSKLTGPESAQRAYVAQILSRLADCMPLRLSDQALTITTAPMTLRFAPYEGLTPTERDRLNKLGVRRKAPETSL